MSWSKHRATMELKTWQHTSWIHSTLTPIGAVAACTTMNQAEMLLSRRRTTRAAAQHNTVDP
jgi:hypothetical protein